MIRLSSILFVLLLAPSSFGQPSPLPVEPIVIGTEPQFVLDRFVIDNYWANKYKRESMKRVFHQPKKFAGNPVIAGEGGYVNVAHDRDAGLYRMWYQVHDADPDKERKTRYALAYAESKDGIEWSRPNLGRFSWKGNKDNNIFYEGARGKRASSLFLLDVPEKDRKGYRYLMLYSETDGQRILGSQDGVNWDAKNDTNISHLHSDTQNAIVFDPRSQEYVMFCRAKHIYRTFKGGIIDTGASRRVARRSSKSLWDTWTSEPQTILVPDNIDEERGFNFYYGMPVKYHAGIYWGFLWPFKMNDDIITELVFSRDGIHFQRLEGRPRMIDLGAKDTWDDGMVFGGAQWLKMGDEWWMYYAGHDGPHNTRKRNAGIGLIKLRKEGFVSMKGPPIGGGVLVTRQLVWPGGKLLVNADASAGELKVRVTDSKRKVLPGLDYDDCVPFTGDAVRQAVAWKNRSIAELAGQTIRLEIFLKNADLYTFQAAGK